MLLPVLIKVHNSSRLAIPVPGILVQDPVRNLAIADRSCINIAHKLVNFQGEGVSWEGGRPLLQAYISGGGGRPGIVFHRRQIVFHG